jgi:c(7)-type cytochrome triheme protein
MLIIFMGTASALPVGVLEFPAVGNEGHVVFNRAKHTELGIKCMDCHGKIFMSIPDAKEAFESNGHLTQFKMDDMFAGKYCGACHNGTKAFAASKDKPENCEKCHQK